MDAGGVDGVKDLVDMQTARSINPKSFLEHFQNQVDATQKDPLSTLSSDYFTTPNVSPDRPKRAKTQSSPLELFLVLNFNCGEHRRDMTIKVAASSRVFDSLREHLSCFSQTYFPPSTENLRDSSLIVIENVLMAGEQMQQTFLIRRIKEAASARHSTFIEASIQDSTWMSLPCDLHLSTEYVLVHDFWCKHKFSLLSVFVGPPELSEPIMATKDSLSNSIMPLLQQPKALPSRFNRRIYRRRCQICESMVAKYFVSGFEPPSLKEPALEDDSPKYLFFCAQCFGMCFPGASITLESIQDPVSGQIRSLLELTPEQRMAWGASFAVYPLLHAPPPPGLNF